VHLLDILGKRTPIPFRIVTNLCHEVTELTWHHNRTLWFTSVPNVIRIMSLFVFLIILYILIYKISRSSPILWSNLCRELAEYIYAVVLYFAESQDTRRGHALDYVHQNITYKLCHFDTVHYSYYTYGWLVTRNFCRELHATVHKGRWLCIVRRAYYHNITLWFTSVPNVIIMSLFVVPIILYIY
jgi:hypothetical protein